MTISIPITAVICIFVYLCARIIAQIKTARCLNIVQAVQETGYGGQDELVLPMLLHQIAVNNDDVDAVQLSVEESGHGATSEMV